MWPGNKVELPKKSKPFALQPRLDEEGQIRCDSRLRYAEFLSHDAGFTKILLRRHQVTKLIVKKYHEDENNASGTNRTSASLSTQIWIIAGRDGIRKWEKECNECCRRKAKAAKQIMALLNSDFSYRFHHFPKQLCTFSQSREECLGGKNGTLVFSSA